jgi:uncharacterized membrane protein HdeD (DUF308 family)
LNQKISGAIGVIGGVIDVLAGLALLQPPVMRFSSTPSIGYFLLVFGIVVFLSGLYIFFEPMLKGRTTFGWLMGLYGIIMLAIGLAMIERMFPMMQGSTLSGGTMIIVGAAMLYSGYDMRRA